MAAQLCGWLERQGHRVRVADRVREVLPFLDERHVDLLAVDCRQLEQSGAALFRLLGRRPRPPLVLPLSAYSPAADEAERLRAAVTKAQTLLARGDDEVLRVGDLALDMASKRVVFRGQHVSLPPIQFRLLAYLMRNAGRVVGAQELLEVVWGYEGDEGEARELVKAHVRQIRRRLGLEAHHADYVQSVRGFGYQVTAPAADSEP